MNQSSIEPIDVIHSMTNKDLYLYKRKNSNAGFQDLITYDNAMQGVKTGTVFVSKSKEDLVNGKGHIVTSYETLAEQYNDLSHWTPNTFRGGTYYDFKKRIIKGHSKDNIKQVNVIGFDIDTKDVDLYALFMGCDELGLPWPNVLLETPRGFQGFFILETPFYIHKRENFKALRTAERLASNVLEALSEHAPIDIHCNPFGFYRIPNDSNILYFHDELAHTSDLIKWSKTYEHERKKDYFQVFYGGKHASACQYVSSDWYKTLLNTVNIRAGEYVSSRNNALLTLALANYADGIEYNVAYDVLDQWNSALSNPLSLQEFNRTLKSAYSGKYKGVKRSYVESLLENWTDGSVSFVGQNGWYKFAKPREERVRSHYKEWEQDIIKYVNKQANPHKPFVEGSLRTLAKLMEIPLSSFKEVLKKSKCIYKQTKGRGRSAVTYITTKSMLFNHLIAIRKEDINTIQSLFKEIFIHTKRDISPTGEHRRNQDISYADTS